MKSFLEALDERVLVCDGAMGTMLYAKGIFINRCFDALNTTEPNVVAKVHDDYVRAGAEVIETNTFGANRIKLRSFGLADQVHNINLQGVSLAREVVKGRAYLAGAIGPLGIRIEPWGKTGIDEAKTYFCEQAQALAEGGVDLFVLETFRDLRELNAAIRALRSVSDLPIVAQMTIEEDGNTLDGTPPEQFAPALDASGADVIGVNCSIGPAPMLETIQRMALATGARLSAQPNAGRPRDIEGRNIYLSSPEYMASYARRFVQQRVRLVGGCCGSTPEHIRQMKTVVQTLAPAVIRGVVSIERSKNIAAPVISTVDDVKAVVPQIEKSELGRNLAEGRFTKAVSLLPPNGHVYNKTIERAKVLKSKGIDVITIPDVSHGTRMSPLSLAALVQQQAGIETILQYSCRDRNILGMQSDMLGAYAMGVRNMLLVTGDARSVGDYPDATTVFDVDSIGLTNIVTSLNQGLDVGGQAISQPTTFHTGVMVNPGAESLQAELRRFAYKVEAGAEFAITKPVFDVSSVESFFKEVESFGVPIMVGLWLFESVLNAEFMANEVPGVKVPNEVLERMRKTSNTKAAAAEGVAIASELARSFKDLAQGIHVAMPSSEIDSALEVMEAIG